MEGKVFGRICVEWVRITCIAASADPCRADTCSFRFPPGKTAAWKIGVGLDLVGDEAACPKINYVAIIAFFEHQIATIGHASLSKAYRFY